MRRRTIILLAITAVLLIVVSSAAIIPHRLQLQKTPEEITEAIDIIAQSISNRDENQFLSQIDSNNKVFYAEEKHFFEDIKTIDLKNFKIAVKHFDKLNSDTYMVGLSESYTLNAKTEKLQFDAIFKRDGARYRFSDLYFETLETEYFIIKYTPALHKQAQKLSTFIDDAYNNLLTSYGKAPEDKTIIKLYDNNQVFSFFIKPSIQFKMGGWYEYPESIKINMSSLLDKVLPDEEFKDMYVVIISHELTHRANSIESLNNIPYWMAEGLATFVENRGALDTTETYMPIAELEKIRLEHLTDNQEIDNYYKSAYANISSFINKYGIDKVHMLLSELGQYGQQVKTQGEAFDENNKKFHEVLQRNLSLTIEQLDEILKK